MGSLINNIFKGFIILSILGALNGLTEIMGKKASKAGKQGLMSYSAFTKALTK